ncbi:MAG: twin-arginine translocase subunit TatB [Pseudomonadales bacterium]|nr:twin-arginine translocase subunit TatB [Pseudomonadales bacterium]MCP5357070.1 twin-arginine translocase subunit TatB [Pseudomonadales bacterium]
MFDIGFMELVLISIVALIVIGPERLPGAIRTATLWIGRAKRSFNQVKAEIEKEINADDIRRQLHNEAILADLKKTKNQANKLIENTREGVNKLNADVNATLDQEEAELKSALSDEETPVKREQPAAPVDDPASIDEVDESDTSEGAPAESLAADPAEETDGKPDAPVEDFYNNPSSGTVRVAGRHFQPTSSLDDETDSGRRS